MKMDKYTWGSEAYAGAVIAGYGRSLARCQAAWAELQPLFPKTRPEEVEINVSAIAGTVGFPALLFPTHGVTVPSGFIRVAPDQFHTYH
jgi:hypothetical protein